MSIRKRKWTHAGQIREAWVVDYVDNKHTRRLKTFERKRDADAFNTRMAHEKGEGVHVADRASTTAPKPANCG